MPRLSPSWLVAAQCYAVYALPATDIRRAATDALQYGAIGDSWASGVTYGLFDYTNYDDNKSGCMRVNHAYSVQLQKDWPGGQAPDFTFAACSGARLYDMYEGQRQMDQLDPRTDVVTMQAGGNDAGFYSVARDCIYHSESKEYGAAYPDPSGECYKSLDQASKFVEANQQDPGTWRYTDDTIRDIVFNHPIGQRDSFRLYVIGYAHLFNVDSPGSDWCNDQSFTVSLSEYINGTQVKLSKDVRSAINDLTTRLNAQIEDVVRNLNMPKVTFVSVTEGFTGHRFCEAGHTRTDQYFGNKVWFWNASPDGLFPPLIVVEAPEQQTDDNEWDAAYNRTYAYEPALEEFNWVDLLQVEKGPSAQSPHQNWSPGIALRPMHPTEEGHAAIKNALKTVIA